MITQSRGDAERAAGSAPLRLCVRGVRKAILASILLPGGLLLLAVAALVLLSLSLARDLREMWWEIYEDA